MARRPNSDDLRKIAAVLTVLEDIDADAYIVHDMERVFDYVHDREDGDCEEYDREMGNETN
jgi:hypothetical protein